MPGEKNQFCWFHFNLSVPFLLINVLVPRVTMAEISCQARTAEVLGAVLGLQIVPHMYSPSLQQDHPKAQALPVGVCLLSVRCNYPRPQLRRKEVSHRWAWRIRA